MLKQAFKQNKKLIFLCLVIYLISLFIRGYPIFFYGYPYGWLDSAYHTINILSLPQYPTIMFNYDRNLNVDPILKLVNPDSIALQDNPPLFYLSTGILSNILLPFTKDISSGYLSMAILYSLVPVILFLFLKFVMKNGVFAFFGAIFLAISPSDFWHLRQGYWTMIFGTIFFFLAIHQSFRYFSDPNRRNFSKAMFSIVLMLIGFTPYIIIYCVSMVFFSVLNYKEKKIFLRFLKITLIAFIISLPFLINFLNGYFIPNIKTFGARSASTPIYMQEINAVMDLTDILWIIIPVGAFAMSLSLITGFKREECIKILTPIMGIIISFLLGGYYFRVSEYPSRIFGGILPHIIVLLSTYGIYFFYQYAIKASKEGARIKNCLIKKSTQAAFVSVVLFIMFLVLFPRTSFLLNQRPMIDDEKNEALRWLRYNTEKTSTVYFIGFFSDWRHLSFRNASEISIKESGTGQMQFDVDLLKALDHDYIVVSIEDGTKELKDFFENVKNTIAGMGLQITMSNEKVNIFKVSNRESLKTILQANK